jgi:hypothetical protein
VRKAFRDTAGHARAPVVDHRRFFGADLAFGARFGVLGGWQGCQIQIQPEPLVIEGVTQCSALATKQQRTGLPQLFHVLISKAIEGTCQRRLIGEGNSAPGPRERWFRTQAGIDLTDCTTASQNADQHIEQLTGGSMIDCFEWQMDRRQSRPKKVAAGQTVAQDTQRGKVGFVWHVHQSDRGAHCLPPQ